MNTQKTPAILYNVLGRKVNANSFAKASIENFRVSAGCEIDSVDFKRYSPFSFENGSIILAETHSVDFKKPFLYQAQRNSTTNLIKVQAQDVELPDFDKSKLTFIFSIGRCGSTLLSKLMAAANYNEVSEADIFDREASDEVLNTAVNMFMQHYSMENAKSSFKFRSQTNRFVDVFIRLFKESNFIFLYRDKEDWAKSFSGKFNWDAQTMLHSYMLGCKTLKKLINAQVNLKVIKYEELINNPYIFMNAKPTEEEVLAISGVMAVDSQLAAGLNNANKSYDEKNVEYFLNNMDLDIDFIRNT